MWDYKRILIVWNISSWYFLMIFSLSYSIVNYQFPFCDTSIKGLVKGKSSGNYIKELKCGTFWIDIDIFARHFVSLFNDLFCPLRTKSKNGQSIINHVQCLVFSSGLWVGENDIKMCRLYSFAFFGIDRTSLWLLEYICHEWFPTYLPGEMLVSLSGSNIMP